MESPHFANTVFSLDVNLVEFVSNLGANLRIKKLTYLAIGSEVKIEPL